MNRNFGKRAGLVGALMLAATAWSASANAATLTFDQVLDGGTMAYSGVLGTPLTGSGIRIDLISDGTVATTLECRGCILSFTTGGSTSESAFIVEYAGGGTLSIVGSAYSGADLDPTTADGVLVASGVLVVGSFTGGALIDGGSVLTFNGFGIDVKNPDLLAYFGITDTDFTFATTEISATTGANIRGAFNVAVEEADLTNTSSPVPEPASALLLGLGFLGSAAAARRRFLRRA